MRRINDAPNALLKLMAIKPETIEHPAWVKKPFASKTGFELLLDRIETMIKMQLLPPVKRK
jgi:hypothetical protein